VTALAVGSVEALLDAAPVLGEASLKALLAVGAVLTALAVGETLSYRGFHLKSLRAIVVS
jgi:hypothetical protein